MYPRLLALLLCGALPVFLAAQAGQPTYEVQLRYRLPGAGNDRIDAYRAFRAGLKKAGFTRDKAEEEAAENEAIDTTATRMTGTVPAAKVEALLRTRHVRALLLVPSGKKLPGKGARVRTDIALSAGFLPEVQRDLWQQTAGALTKAGFVPAVGYDHRGFSRLVGSVPVENLGKLLADVRLLIPADEREAPLKNIDPVRVTTARPDLPVPAAPLRLPDVPKGQEKFSPALRSVLAGAGAAGRQRMEVILSAVPSGTAWRRDLERAGVVVEGRMGTLVTVAGVPKTAAKALADRPEVVAVRLPRRGMQAPLLRGTDAPAKWEALKASGAASLHALGRRGKGARIALIADDFSGWEKLAGVKRLDLTAERNRDLLPDKMPDRAEGHGVRCARAIQKTAPDAELTLVRIDAAAPYMMEGVARAINGERARTIAMEQRFAELKADRENLDLQRERVAEQRRALLASDDTDEKELKTKQENYKREQQRYDDAEAAYRARVRRATKFEMDLAALKGTRIVASALVWPDGHPVDGSSALSRYFDDRAFRAALWFQAAGDTAGQVWAGPFRDADGNGVMEFTDARRLPKGSWTPELNFLGWQGRGGKVGDALPVGTKLRLTLQWNEAHDPTPLRAGEDPYRSPLAKLRLVVAYQPDPAGKDRPADDLEVVAATIGDPQRLAQSLHAGTYEHTLEVDVRRGGRYAVFVEGKAPDSIHPEGESPLPALKKKSDLSVRLFVRTLAGTGRAVWTGFTTKTAALGMPADSRQVITVAAADSTGSAQPTSATGSPFRLGLLTKPDLLAYDEGDGTALAACQAAGLAALARGNVYDVLRAAEGKVMRIATGR